MSPAQRARLEAASGFAIIIGATAALVLAIVGIVYALTSDSGARLSFMSECVKSQRFAGQCEELWKWRGNGDDQ